LACDYLAGLSVKSVWHRFFSSALFVVGCVGFQNWLDFFGKGFGKSSFHLVSKSLSQFRFVRSKLAFAYLAFWQNMVFILPASLWVNFVFVGQGFWLFGVFVSHAFCQLPKIKLCVKISVMRSGRRCLFSANESSSSTAPNKACTRRVGVSAIYRHFSGFEFSYISNIVHARPHAGNANRWAFPCKII